MLKQDKFIFFKMPVTVAFRISEKYRLRIQAQGFLNTWSQILDSRVELLLDSRIICIGRLGFNEASRFVPEKNGAHASSVAVPCPIAKIFY